MLSKVGRRDLWQGLDFACPLPWFSTTYQDTSLGSVSGYIPYLFGALSILFPLCEVQFSYLQNEDNIFPTCLERLSPENQLK